MVAVTDLLASIVTVHGPVPVHAPLHPAKTALPLTTTVNVTEPPAKAALQVLPQLMPAGLLVTVPRDAAVPFLRTLSVFVATALATVNGNAVDALDPGLIAETCAVPAAAMSAA
jgi:hypothetical protein